MSGRNKTSNGEVDDRHHLVVGEPQIHDALNEIAQADIRITVLHHPFEWLADFERHGIEDRLEDASHFILHGHEHRSKVVPNPLTQCVTIPAGAGYDLRIAEHPRYANAYNWVSFDVAAGQGLVFLRHWDGTNSSWTKDTQTHKKEEGVVPINFPKSEPPKTPSTEAAKEDKFNIVDKKLDKGAKTRLQKLIKTLDEQLKLPELNPIVKEFSKFLHEDEDFPAFDEADLPTILVTGSGNRNTQIGHFLSAIEAVVDAGKFDKSSEEAVKILFAYLIQTLVVKCKDEDDLGLTRIAVELKHTVELISLARNTSPQIPGQDSMEHKNGKRNPHFELEGRYFPQDGEFNPDAACENIAKDLLKELMLDPDDNEPENINALNMMGYKPDEPNYIKTLAVYLKSHGNQPRSTRVFKGLIIKENSGHNKLQIDQVADKFYRELAGCRFYLPLQAA
ncbi:metallophosphoesterase [Methylomonas paludis]|uniref:Metallophosphoesterase n=1 Tax=Methylomonas paludis TaxID=1173101 RepID=A0A975R9K2_9GAMM|nr:metallophosphoesterase [Methylomonas paludis]QWF70324.1 metallophosphoesterase [Methylomonas paludis]